MVKKTDVMKIIFDCIDEFNQINGTNIKQSQDTVLYGEGSELDSIDFVSLIVSIEDSIHNEFDTLISLTAEKAMSKRNSPFRTIDTLTDYVIELLKWKI